jgi:hypothetical protein
LEKLSMSELAISRASRSHHGGLLDHFGFEVASSKSYPVNGGYDLVHLFRLPPRDGRSRWSAAHMLSFLKEDGTWMVLEPFAHDTPEANQNPVGRIYYSIFTMVCTPAVPLL